MPNKKIVKLSDFKFKTYGYKAIFKRISKRNKNQTDTQDLLSNFSCKFERI